MKTSIEDFNYSLPKKLIATEPLPRRDGSKLLTYNRTTGLINHENFNDILKYFTKGDMIILNNTKVIPGRLFVTKSTGGKIELLFHKKLDKHNFQCIYRSSRALKVDMELFIDNKRYFTVKNIHENLITLHSTNDPIPLFKKYGQIPLPKYIKRKTNADDIKRYQTTYASINGSVAAPTAGLHFTKEILNKLSRKGILIEYLTLHVTYNTFKPIKTNNYMKHDIGSEYCEIESTLINKIKNVKENNKKVYAVGTTTTRALESYYTNSIKGNFKGEVDLYITPGYKFKIIDGLITNFHLPKSTLLLLVSSLIGVDILLSIYKVAIQHEYRFYSYGDSMLIKS